MSKPTLDLEIMDALNLSKLSKQQLLDQCITAGIDIGPPRKTKTTTKAQLIELLIGLNHSHSRVPSALPQPSHPLMQTDTANPACFETIHIPKPLLKWVGGKTQILDKLLSKFPTDINNYFEIFLGGGSVLLAVLSYIQQGAIQVRGKLFAFDINEPLIYVYKNIQTDPSAVYAHLQEILAEWNTCADPPPADAPNRNPQTLADAKQTKECYYYWARARYNRLSASEKITPAGSALFIFLNKTCFRGVFRVGPRGFNVPFGNYANPEIINKAHLDEIHALIQPVIFECCDYATSLQRVQHPDDYVYMDPPYAPETATSFVKYTENGFNHENHVELFQWVDALTADNKKVMMSNADVPLVRNHFNRERYHVAEIVCRRSINSKKPDAKTNEVIITNY